MVALWLRVKSLQALPLGDDMTSENVKATFVTAHDEDYDEMVRDLATRIAHQVAAGEKGQRNLGSRGVPELGNVPILGSDFRKQHF